MLTEGSVIATKYRLGRMFARGGMGSVWHARHLLLDADVAIKLMDPSIAASPPERARFAAEARAAAKLKSRHIVQVNDYGVEGDTPYIVMELLEGEDLGARLRREGRLSLSAAGELLTQVARGLRKAHETGFIHRDLKPANIFLAKADDEETAKILDFGIARFTERSPTTEMTRTGTLLGSPPYMSPEQVRGLRDIDFRTDLWSLGVIMFRAVTGSLPFQSDQIGDLIFKICAERAPAASSLTPNMPVALDQFFERALAKDPAGRFQSLREMADAFSAACHVSSRGPLSSIAECSPESEQAWQHAPVVPHHSTVPLQGSVAHPTPLMSNAETAPFVPAVQPRTTATELGLPAAIALKPPAVVSQTIPFTDAGTLSTGGRTIRTQPSGSTRNRTWWMLGFLGLASIILAVVLSKELRSSEARTDDTYTPVGAASLSSTAVPPMGSPHTASTVTDTGATAPPGASGTVGSTADPTSQDTPVQGAGGPAKSPDATGKININSFPVSKVVLDGRPLGNTPKVGLTLTVGKHTVTLVNPQSGQRYNETVEVKPGGTAKVAHRF